MTRFFMPLRDLSAKYSVMQSAMASTERIFELLDTEPRVRDFVDAAAAQLGVTLEWRGRGIEEKGIAVSAPPELVGGLGPHRRIGVR